MDSQTYFATLGKEHEFRKMGCYMMDNQDKNKWKSLFPPGVNSVNHPALTMKREIYVKSFKNRKEN